MKKKAVVTALILLSMGIAWVVFFQFARYNGHKIRADMVAHVVLSHEAALQQILRKEDGSSSEALADAGFAELTNIPTTSLIEKNSIQCLQINGQRRFVIEVFAPARVAYTISPNEPAVQSK